MNRRKTFIFFAHGPLMGFMEKIGINFKSKSFHFITLNDKKVRKVISELLSWEPRKMGKTNSAWTAGRLTNWRPSMYKQLTENGRNVCSKVVKWQRSKRNLANLKTRLCGYKIIGPS